MFAASSDCKRACMAAKSTSGLLGVDRAMPVPLRGAQTRCPALPHRCLRHAVMSLEDGVLCGPRLRGCKTLYVNQYGSWGRHCAASRVFSARDWQFDGIINLVPLWISIVSFRHTGSLQRKLTLITESQAVFRLLPSSPLHTLNDKTKRSPAMRQARKERREGALPLSLKRFCSWDVTTCTTAAGSG